MEYAKDEQIQKQLKGIPNAVPFFISTEKDYSTSMTELEAMKLPLVLVADQREISKCIALVELLKQKRSEIAVQYNAVFKWRTPVHPISGKKTEDDVKGEKIYDVPVFLGVLSDKELDLESTIWTKQTL